MAKKKAAEHLLDVDFFGLRLTFSTEHKLNVYLGKQNLQGAQKWGVLAFLLFASAVTLYLVIDLIFVAIGVVFLLIGAILPIFAGLLMVLVGFVMLIINMFLIFLGGILPIAFFILSGVLALTIGYTIIMLAYAAIYRAATGRWPPNFSKTFGFSLSKKKT